MSTNLNNMPMRVYKFFNSIPERIFSYWSKNLSIIKAITSRSQ